MSSHIDVLQSAKEKRCSRSTFVRLKRAASAPRLCHFAPATFRRMTDCRCKLVLRPTTILIHNTQSGTAHLPPLRTGGASSNTLIRSHITDEMGDANVTASQWRLVEVGRVVLFSNGPFAGRLAAIVEIIDHKRVRQPEICERIWRIWRDRWESRLDKH
jgi:hypothetical protein